VSRLRLNILLNYGIALIWLINGLYCKILNLVPRHTEIVGRILGEQHARLLAILIGVAEIGMAIWIVTKISSNFNVAVQITIIMVMNVLEFIVVPDLLLWGKLNIIFASLFCVVILINHTNQMQKTYVS
jgi:hypothetical protein